MLITSFSLARSRKRLCWGFIMTNFILGITGASGSGKTYLANLLHNKFYPDSSIITQDNYYLPQNHLPLKKRNTLNFDHPSMIDWRLAYKQLSFLKNNSPIQMPQYSFKTHTRLKRTKIIKPKKLIIFEGIFAFSEIIRPLLSYKVFLDTDFGLCFNRRLNRDINERGRTKSSVIAQFEDTTKPGFIKFVLPTRRFADLIIENEDYSLLFEILWDRINGGILSP